MTRLDPKPKRSAVPAAQPIRTRAQNRALRMAALTLGATVAGLAHAGGGPIAGVVNGVNIVLATVMAVCLALATIGIATCGYKILFEGASYRDMSAKLLGSAVCGSAAAIAAMFMT